MEKLLATLKNQSLHLIALGIFLLITAFYFSPYLQGQKLRQMDNTHAKGMAKEVTDYQEKTGDYSAWTNSMFSGMPTYLIKGAPNRSVFNILQKTLHVGLPFESLAIVFLMLMGFYLLLITLEVNMWLSIAGAIAFALSSYNLIFIEAGHITKAYAIAFMAPVLAGAILTYKGKWVAGGIISTIAIGLEMSSSHPQISYYLFMMLMGLGIVYFIYAILEKTLKNFFIASAIIASATVLGILPSTTNLLTTFEYGKYSIRGPSELTPPKDTSKLQDTRTSSGLDKDYALDWSYGKQETFTLLIPNAAGGQLTEKSDTYKGLIANGVPQNVALDFTKSLSNTTYWGAMPFVSGPAYFGAIICFLFVLGLLVVKGPLKWWLLTITCLSIMLAWGKNFNLLTDLFFYYFPYYNKFRAVSTILIIASVTMPLLGILGLNSIIKQELDTKALLKKVYIALGIVGGLTLVMATMPSIFFDFTSANDADLIANLKQSYPDQGWLTTLISSSLISDRASILSSDAFRSFVFIVLSGAAIWLFIKNKINTIVLIAAIGLLVLIDMWSVDKRYLNDEDFVSKSSLNNDFNLSQAEYYIQNDTDPNFRVFNIATNTFNDGVSPYKYKCIGGYHGAKLRRYQDLVEHYLGGSRQNILMIMQQDTSGTMLPYYLSKMNALNMLNPKYILYNNESQPLLNPFAKGNAWFVSNYKVVKTADEEINMLNEIQLSETAIVNKEFETLVKAYKVSPNDSTSTIILTDYKPNNLTYTVNATTDKLTLFSEIYYAKGWNAYVDGKLTPHFRANYVLRAMIIPTGKHTVEFKFEPSSLKIGQTVSLASSILVILLIGGVIFWQIKNSEPAMPKNKK